MANLRRSFLLTSTVLLAQLPLFAADLDNQNIETFRDWINSRRLVTVKELGGQLSISGDIHAEGQVVNKKKKGRREEPHNTFDVEFNLAIDYRADQTWAAAKVRFDNDAGAGSKPIGEQTTNKVKVDRAYFGYRLYDDNQHTADVEVGRRAMNTIFDSKIEFGSNFDGALVKDSYAFDQVGDFYYQVGVFLVSEHRSQFAAATEIGLQNIAGTGFYTKYSLVDWDTKTWRTIPPQFEFLVSQLIIGYRYVPQIWDKTCNFFLAALTNHLAKQRQISDHKRQAWGGYIGFSIGQIKLKGDFAIEANYQVVQAQSIPAFDSQGVGLGAESSDSFYYHEKSGDAIPNKRKEAEGDVNFRGYEITFQYMLTNNLNLLQQWKQGITLDNHIGPFRKYKRFEIDLVYLF